MCTAEQFGCQFATCPGERKGLYRFLIVFFEDLLKDFFKRLIRLPMVKIISVFNHISGVIHQYRVDRNGTNINTQM